MRVPCVRPRLVVQPIPKKWAPDLIELMNACWSLKHTERPEFRDIVPRLKVLHEAELALEADRTKFQMLKRALYP